MSDAQPLCTVDVIPGHSGVEIEVDFSSPTSLTYVRFQAVRFTTPERDEERSEWTGWYLYQGEPVSLIWDDFWKESSDTTKTENS